MPEVKAAAGGCECPGQGSTAGLPERLRGGLPLRAAGHGPGGRGSNRGSVAAGTAEAAASTGANEAGGNTNQAAGRACKDGQAGTATGREVALSGGAGDPPQGRVDMARSLMAAGMEMDKAIRAAGYASRNAYHRAARKTDEEREQHGHEAHFAGAGSGAGNGEG